MNEGIVAALLAVGAFLLTLLVKSRGKGRGDIVPDPGYTTTAAPPPSPAAVEKRAEEIEAEVVRGEVARVEEIKREAEAAPSAAEYGLEVARRTRGRE